MEFQIIDYLDQPGLYIPISYWPSPSYFRAPNSDLRVTFPRIQPVTRLLLSFECRILEGACQDVYSHFRCYLELCCFILDFPLEEFHFVRPRTTCLAWIVRV